MTGVFTSLSQLLDASAGLAILAAGIWGIASVLLSPCHLAGIPIIIGYISGRRELPKGRALALSSFFAIGILVTIAILGVITGLLGRILGDIGAVSRYAPPVVMVVFGLVLLDVIPLPFQGSSAPTRIKGSGLWTALLLGLIFGAVLGPCTFAFMAPVIAVAFRAAATDFAFPAALFAAYAAGHCLVILLAGTFSGILRRYFGWSQKSKGTLIIKRICGVLVIAAGVYMVIA